ncbi:hypothetical protein BGZ65_004115, partial [Modicella reniformis]
DNDILNIKLSRARKNIHRLRVERSFLFDRLDNSEQATHSPSSSTSSSDSDTDEDGNNGDASSKSHHRQHPRFGLDRLKRYRNSYSHQHGSSHTRHDSSHSQPPVNSTSALNSARSITPPSRASSVPSTARHSASSSVQIKEPLQAISLSPSGGSGGNGGAGNTGGKRGATKKRRKDPLAPKRPSNAFFIFSQQHRQQAREEKKEGNQSELTKFLGQQWKSMTLTEKKRYSLLAEQDKQRYSDEMIQYEHEHGLGVNGHPDTSKTRKKAAGKVGRPSKHDKAAAESKRLSNNNNSSSSSNGKGIDNNSNTLTATPTNGHSPTKRMEIHNMINEDTDGEETTSHDDDDIKMDEGSEDDQDDEDDDEVDHETEDAEEVEDVISRDQRGIKNKSNGAGCGHGEDVEMVDTHRAQDPAVAQGLVVSA